MINNEDEATGDNRKLFSEIQMGGDIDDSTSNMSSLAADFRLSRLRRETIEDQRLSSAASRHVATDNKVTENNSLKIF